MTASSNSFPFNGTDVMAMFTAILLIVGTFLSTVVHIATSIHYRKHLKVRRSADVLHGVPKPKWWRVLIFVLPITVFELWMLNHMVFYHWYHIKFWLFLMQIQGIFLCHEAAKNADYYDA